ncbi:restriction endonuclease subunit S [Azospirillum sp. A26]|uniref:restriction endonuclease subunit S n=1 Tax=Azospirillum sp. A26 TaxID=3160607 RepID=UPI00366A8E48
MSGSPASWPLVKIGDIARVKAGATPSREKQELYFSEFGHPWVKTGDLTDGLLCETAERITEKAVADTSCEIHPPGTVLVAMYGGFQQIGRTGILQVYAATNQAVSAIIANRQRVIPHFLNYCLVYSRPAWKKIAASSRKDPNITKQDILDFQIPLPPLSEQRRIAEILSSVDEAIAATQAVIEQTRTVKQSVLNHLLTKGIRHTRFKQTEIGVLPEAWEVVTVDDICQRISVGIVVQPAQYYVPEGVKCFRSANVREGRVEDSNWVYISPEANEQLAKSRLEAGDVLVVRSGYTGTSCVVTPEFAGANCIDIIFARPNQKEVNSHFLSALINSPIGREQVLRSEGGMAQKHFNVSAMKKMLVPLPSMVEQEVISSRVIELNAQLWLAEAEISRLQRLKSALMSDLLTGRKRVSADALSPAL